jgi:hypothetical protein
MYTGPCGVVQPGEKEEKLPLRFPNSDDLPAASGAIFTAFTCTAT